MAHRLMCLSPRSKSAALTCHASKVYPHCMKPSQYAASRLVILPLLYLLISTGDAQAQLKPRPHPYSEITAIVEADVVAATYTYDEQIGPRTVMTLDNLNVLFGKAPKDLTVQQYGGPLPDGRYVSASIVPELRPGSRYVFFFGPPKWFYSPVRHGLVFRVESVQGRTILTDVNGIVISGFTKDGPTFSNAKLFDRLDQPDRLLPLKVDADRASKADLSAAVGREAFVSTALAVISSVGAVPDVPSLQPVRRVNWRTPAASTKSPPTPGTLTTGASP